VNAPSSNPQRSFGERPRFERLAGSGLRVWAAAKINLNLLVRPRRPDGYHPLDSTVCRITLFDDVELRPRDDGRIRLTTDGADCGPDEDNLALRGARLLQKRAGEPVRGADICLHKRIPPGRGLGGGSSDAAAVLAGLNSLWELKLADSELAKLVGELGSDGPLFFGPPAARMTGYGQNVSPVEVYSFFALLHLPPFPCATPEVYRQYDESPPRPAEPLDAELFAQPPSTWRDKLVNQLADAAERLHPELGRLRRRLSEAAGIPASLTGSGSAIFLLCDDQAEADERVARIRGEAPGETLIVRRNPW